MGFGLPSCAIGYDSARLAGDAPAMPHANFCVECGARLAGRFCEHCARRLGAVRVIRPLIVLVVIAVAAFAVGRYLRPAPPPLIIQRAANSPLSDKPAELGNSSGRTTSSSADKKDKEATSLTIEEGYLCGARTKKGTPCKRRVHIAGERCFQHKGLPAMVPLEKLIIKPVSSSK